jgi:hypothetical protein
MFGTGVPLVGLVLLVLLGFTIATTVNTLTMEAAVLFVAVGCLFGGQMGPEQPPVRRARGAVADDGVLPRRDTGRGADRGVGKRTLISQS